MPTPAEYKKQWKECRKRSKEIREYTDKTLKEFENGTYEHPYYLISQGITKEDIKRKVGFND